VKIFWIVISIWLISTLHSASANTKNTTDTNPNEDYCNQQLIQASASCLNPEVLESCISDNLKKAGCEIEIVVEKDINICNEECSPDLTAVLFDEEKNILPLTEGE